MRGFGSTKHRSPKLRAKRLERRRRNKTLLPNPNVPVDKFTVHGAKRRLDTDAEYAAVLLAEFRATTKEQLKKLFDKKGYEKDYPRTMGKFRGALRHVWALLRRKETT